ncbi:MFS transporter [Streptomyces sp. 7-21]|uniref:MFS transporter n=1 Tax=Streptomyces sp. 7-21 TaxID=2802283 RepID=UPI00191D324E|nr:MFS transporter [Streptomyces sp. 7-21]MBL1068259.1 MFS transporter [Streptomyces sp. 7-21]
MAGESAGTAGTSKARTSQRTIQKTGKTRPRAGRRRGLGPEFGKLWAATTVSNVGDGIAAAAAPLLVASLTDDPLLVGLAVFAQQLPWLLFSLLSGALVDRLDRRRLVVAVNLARAAVIASLALAIWRDVAVLPAVYAAGFLIGTCETLGDTAAATLVPAVVAPADLPRANARMTSVFHVVNRLAAPPVGAALFVAAAALPFGVNAVAFVAAAGFVALMRPRAAAPRPARPQRRPALRSDIAEGVRWLWCHPAIRMVAVSLCLMNVTLMAAMSVLVLYTRERLGLGELGYGLFLAASALGGLAGALCSPRLQGRFRPSVLLRTGLVIETLTHVGLALPTTVWIAAPVFVVFGVHTGVWDNVSRTLRQRAVPEPLRGRVESVFLMFGMGGSALGALIGGPVARALGITGPFWGSAVVMAVLTAVAWRAFGRHATAEAAGASESR